MKINWTRLLLFIGVEIFLFFLSPLLGIFPILCLIGWGLAKAANE